MVHRAERKGSQKNSLDLVTNFVRLILKSPDFADHTGIKLKRIQVMCQYNGEQIGDQAIKWLTV